VHFLWQRLQQKGFIYLGEHEGYYCKADETFVPESQLITKEIDGKSVKVTEAGHAVEWISEKNYKFKLAQMKPFLQELLSQDGFVVPAQRAEDIRQQLKTEQHDLSVSRSSARSKWGIEVKDDSSQVVYVWLDALTNYLTAAGFPNPMQVLTQVQLLEGNCIFCSPFFHFSTHNRPCVCMLGPPMFMLSVKTLLDFTLYSGRPSWVPACIVSIGLKSIF
jgi:methionyl-tRNA synthetase